MAFCFISPWDGALRSSLSLSLTPSPFCLSPCLIGTGLLSLWRCVQIQLVCVMLCCLLLLSNGHSGQESSWTRTHAQTHIHVARGKSSQRLTIHSPHYHTACLSENEVRWVGWGGGDVLLFHPRAPSKRHGIAFNVARFHFHQTRKCHESKGLSLQLTTRFEQLTIAGLKPKLPFVTIQ